MFYSYKLAFIISVVFILLVFGVLLKDKLPGQSIVVQHTGVSPYNFEVDETKGLHAEHVLTLTKKGKGALVLAFTLDDTLFEDWFVASFDVQELDSRGQPVENSKVSGSMFDPTRRESRRNGYLVIRNASVGMKFRVTTRMHYRATDNDQVNRDEALERLREGALTMRIGLPNELY